MVNKEISIAFLSIFSNTLFSYYTHTDIEHLFESSDISVACPGYSNKQNKILNWLKACLEVSSDEAMVVIGKFLENFFEVVESYSAENESYKADKKILETAINKYGFAYKQGGVFYSKEVVSIAPSLSKKIDFHSHKAIRLEFDRSLEAISNNPRDALTSACTLLYSCA